MELSLQTLIVHQIDKQQDAPDAELFLSERPLPIDDRAYLLIEQLHRTFEQKSDRLHGRLADPGDALFPAYLETWREHEQVQDAFVTFSRHSMQALELSLQGVTGAKGGYLVYAHYQVAENEYLGIFLVRDAQGLLFRPADGGDTFEIDETTYLDTNRLAMAVRIRLDRLDSTTGRFVELIKHQRSQAGISEYFVQWIGLEEATTSKAQTETFLQLVEELPLPVDRETGEQLQEGEFQDLVMQYAHKAPQKVVNLKEFDDTFYESTPTARQLVQDQELPLDEEFPIDRSTIRKYNNHKVSHAGLTLYFNRQHVQQGMVRLEGDHIQIFDPELLEQIRDHYLFEQK